MFYPVGTAPNFLEELGKVVAMDLLSNNFDRLPLAWSNSGQSTCFFLENRQIVAVDL